MGVADNYVKEINSLTYGRDLRKPIHDGLKALLNHEGSERPVTVLTKDEYQAIENPDVDTFYAIKDERTPKPNLEHYGIKIDKANPDTSARIEYLYDAVGFSPAYMDYTNSKFEYGSWKDAFFVKNNYPVMLKTDGAEDYRLDPEDHTKRLDGAASNISDLTYDGNAFSCFDCHIWMKFYEDANYQYIEVANYKLDSDFKDYPYRRGNGSVSDKLYYPMYPGHVDGNGKLRSISGVKASSNRIASDDVASAKSNGSIWSIESWSYHLWFHVLLLLMSKNFNSQAAFGNGNTRGNSSATSFKENGLLNTSGQFFGYDTFSDSVKVFYCENVWANRASRCLGMYNANGIYKIKMAPSYTHDNTYSGYVSIDIPTIPNFGYIKDLSFDNFYGFVPKSTVDASPTTYVGDYFYNGNGQTYSLAVGGIVTGGEYCGSWHLDLSVPVGLHSWFIGASLYLE